MTESVAEGGAHPSENAPHMGEGFVTFASEASASKAPISDVLGLRKFLGSPNHPAPEMTFYGASFLDLAAEAAFMHQHPVDFEWFEEREREGPGSVHDVAMMFARSSWQRTAWRFAQLHYDQILKRSIADGQARNLGHPIFGIAQVAQFAGELAAARHYAALATVADILWMGSGFRGGAPQMLARLSDWQSFEQLDAATIANSAPWEGRSAPLSPEAFLAAAWFPAARAKAILQFAPGASGKVPFVERLLDAAEATSSTTDAGTLFEASTAMLLSCTAGFEVRGAREDVSSQTDLLLLYRREPLARMFLPEGYAFVECKHWNERVNAAVVRELGARCVLRNVPLGLLITKNGITGAVTVDSALQDAERERREFLSKGVHILVLSANQLRSAARARIGLESLLLEDYETLRFGRRAP